MTAAAGQIPRETLQRDRKWSDEEWAEAEARLAQRGWLDAGVAITIAERGGVPVPNPVGVPAP